MPRPVAEKGFARLREALPGLPFAEAGAVDDVPGVVDEDRITTAVDGTAYAAAKAAAMSAHATQIEVAGPWFVLSNQQAQPLFTDEYYELVRGEQGGHTPGRATDPRATEPRETDLFDGISDEVSGAGVR